MLDIRKLRVPKVICFKDSRLIWFLSLWLEFPEGEDGAWRLVAECTPGLRVRGPEEQGYLWGREPVILTFCLRAAGVSGCFDQVSFVPFLRLLIKRDRWFSSDEKCTNSFVIREMEMKPHNTSSPVSEEWRFRSVATYLLNKKDGAGTMCRWWEAAQTGH